MGSNNPKHNKLGKLEFWLGRKLATYTKQDPPPTQVGLIPVSVLQALAPPTKVAPTSSKQSATWPGYISSSSPVQKNTAGAAPTPPTIFSSSKTSISSSSSSPSMLPWPPQARPHEPGQTFSDFSSTHIQMMSRGNPLALAKQATPKAIRWQHCITALYTLNVMAPLAQLLSRRCTTRTSGSPSTAPRSRHPSEPWSAHLARPLALHHKMLASAPSYRGGAMALHKARVDPDTIRIIGRWRSDTLLLYLHTT